MFLEQRQFMMWALSNNAHTPYGRAQSHTPMNKNNILHEIMYIVLAIVTFISCLFFVFVQMPIYLAAAASPTAGSSSNSVTSAANSTAIPDDFSRFTAKPPIHSLFAASTSPQGLTPAEVKAAYHLPSGGSAGASGTSGGSSAGGTGTIAIISAFDHPYIESDLAVFDKTFSLAPCTTAGKCLEVHKMTSKEKTNTGWDMESALDTQWAHAIAPSAKILVVEATSDSGTDLLKAVDYARGRSDVVSVSMSWGGDEFKSETKLDEHFSTTSTATVAATAKNTKTVSTAATAPGHNIAWFASSGDDGAGVSWPAVSPNVIAVGGTSLAIDTAGKFFSESAWSGSGGGVSAYENEPTYQHDYSIQKASGKRAIPDVSYAADPIRGFSMYHVSSKTIAKTAPKVRGWYVVGGTSAGAPQWAAIAALGASIRDAISLPALYADKASATYSDFSATSRAARTAPARIIAWRGNISTM
jgi:subtilase family serine protease